MGLEARSNNLLIHNIGAETVVYDRDRQTAHRLNETATAVWQRLDGQTSTEEIASDLRWPSRRLRAGRQEVSHGIEPLEIRRSYHDSNPQTLEGEPAQPLDTVEIEYDLLLHVAGRASLSSRRSVPPRGPPKRLRRSYNLGCFLQRHHT